MTTNPNVPRDDAGQTTPRARQELESLAALLALVSVPEFPAADEVRQVLARAAGEIRAIAAR